MKPITFQTSLPPYSPPVVATIDFPVLAYIDTPTSDGRRLLGPSRGDVNIRLPVPLMTVDGSPYRRVGALLRVTIGGSNVVSAKGVLFERLDGDQWPAVDIGDDPIVKFNKRGFKARFERWELRAVTLRPGRAAWPEMPPATITRMTTNLTTGV